MEIQSRYDDVNCWTLFTGMHNNTEVSQVAVDINEDYGFIHQISSFPEKQGYGTQLIEHLRSLGLNTLEGDADPDSVEFWYKFSPTWKDDSFTIRFDSLEKAEG